MLPGLLSVLVRNERQRREDVALFEIGNLHEWRDGAPAQASVLAFLLAGNLRPASWLEAQRPASFEDVKGIVESLGARWNLDRVEFGAWQPRPGIDHPGRSATVVAVKDGEPTQIGLAFAVDPRLLAAYEVRAENVAFALLNLDVVAPLANRVPTVKSAPSLPALERDIAVVVGREHACLGCRRNDPSERRAPPVCAVAVRSIPGSAA